MSAQSPPFSPARRGAALLPLAVAAVYAALAAALTLPSFTPHRSPDADLLIVSEAGFWIRSEADAVQPVAASSRPAPVLAAPPAAANARAEQASGAAVVSQPETVVELHAAGLNTRSAGATGAAPDAGTEASIGAGGIGGLEQQWLIVHNAERAKAGLSPLTIDASLTGIARRRAADMTAKGYFGHYSPTGDNVFRQLEAIGITNVYAGENLASNNYSDAASINKAMEGFMASPSHRANVLNSHYTRIGIGISVSGNMKYYAIVFMGQ